MKIIIKIQDDKKRILIDNFIFFNVDFENRKVFISTFTHSFDFVFSNYYVDVDEHKFEVESELSLRILQNAFPIVPVQIKQNIGGGLV